MEKTFTQLCHQSFYNLKQNSQSIKQIEKSLIYSSKYRRSLYDKLPTTTNLSEFKILSLSMTETKYAGQLTVTVPITKGTDKNHQNGIRD